MMKRRNWLQGSVLLAALVACTVRAGEDAMSMRISSGAFGDGGAIPERHTCEGSDISPPLAWSGVPEGTRSLVLIVDDPDGTSRTTDDFITLAEDVAKTDLTEFFEDWLYAERLPSSFPD